MLPQTKHQSIAAASLLTPLISLSFFLLTLLQVTPLLPLPLSLTLCCHHHLYITASHCCPPNTAHLSPQFFSLTRLEHFHCDHHCYCSAPLLPSFCQTMSQLPLTSLAFSTATTSAIITSIAKFFHKESLCPYYHRYGFHE